MPKQHNYKINLAIMLVIQHGGAAQTGPYSGLNPRRNHVWANSRTGVRLRGLALGNNACESNAKYSTLYLRPYWAHGL